MNTSDDTPSLPTSADYSAADTVLENAAELLLGGLSRQEVQRIRHALTKASSDIQHKYNIMVLTTQLLPASLPMVEPPAILKQSIMSRIQAAQFDSQRNSQINVQSVEITQAKQHDYEEFTPHYNAKGVSFYTLSSDEGDWLAHPVHGISVKPLATDKERGYATILMRLDAGTVFPSHNHAGAEQCYVVSGEVMVRGKGLGAGSFFSTQAHADHGDITSSHGATVLLVVALKDYRKSAWKVGLKVGVKAVKKRLSRLFA